jgi:hypothetical protein
MAEIDAAIAELARRSLIRRLPDGQLYRASPAEYLIPVEGIGGLATRLDPMGGEIACTARHESLRAAPQDVAWALHVAGEAQVRIIRCVWSIGPEPAAISTAYVRAAVGSVTAADPGSFAGILQSPPVEFPPAEFPPVDFTALPASLAGAADLELAPPQPSVARSLRLLPGQPAIVITVRFDDRVSGEPVALTVAVLKPQYFRVVIQAGDALPRLVQPADLAQVPPDLQGLKVRGSVA